jgi:methyl-accepting chemotaxis protein
MSGLSKMEKTNKITAGIIGAGKRGRAFLESLLKSGSVDIKYIVDKDSRALAFGFAKSNHIPALLDIDEALKKYPAQYIFDATGDEKVLQLLHQKCPTDAHIINYQVSLFFFDLLDGMRENLNREIVSELNTIKRTLTDNSRIIQESSKEVDKVAVNITLLSINASIEASRAGDVGKGFAVVAQAVKETADSARMLSKRIEDVNKDSVEAVQKIDTALAKLTR